MGTGWPRGSLPLDSPSQNAESLHSRGGKWIHILYILEKSEYLCKKTNKKNIDSTPLLK